MAVSERATSMRFDDKARSVIRGLIYPIQFDRNPLDGVDRVLKQVVMQDAMDTPAQEYVASITAALDSPEQLSGLIPQDHPEPVIRAYLSEVRRRLQGRGWQETV